MLRKICNSAISALARGRILSPRRVCQLRYFLKFKKLPDLKNPQNLNEKIMWLEFNTDTAEWTRASDKVAVRQYLAERGAAQYAPRLLAVWDSAEQVDFTTLPQKFVLKPNNGFGSVVIVDDKSRFSPDALRPLFRQWLREPFGRESGEPHYIPIPRRIYAEELLERDNDDDTPLVDYKFWCMNGKAVTCLTCCNRNFSTHHVDLGIYDLPAWRHRPDAIYGSYRNDSHVERPAALPQMIALAEQLAAPFPLVRVDLYYTGGKIYFGEMTFTSNAARMRYFTDEFLLDLGAKADISNLITRKK